MCSELSDMLFRLAMSLSSVDLRGKSIANSTTDDFLLRTSLTIQAHPRCLEWWIVVPTKTSVLLLT